MRAVVQRVTSASVSVAGAEVACLDAPGLLVLLGVGHDDTAEQARWLAAKIAGLRILREERSVVEAGAPVLLVSQFTLLGDVRRGRRPTWAAAAPGPVAEPLVSLVGHELESLGVLVRTGAFGADMQVQLVNDGPTTLVVDTPAAPA